MLTKRKSDGKLIEVEPTTAYDGELGYWDSENGDFHYPSDLDFDVEEAEQTEITIDRDEYEELRRYERYCANWAHGIVVCPHCGEFNPDGYICANCGKDRHH